jgi:hypothetical protein
MLTRFAGTFIVATIALTSMAGAVEVKRKIEIVGEAPKVWTQIGGWCAIADWHPAVAKCEESSADGKPVRTLTLKDGGVIKETQLKKTATSYTYQIDESPLPVKNYTATFAVVPDDDDKDEVNIAWSAKFEAKGKDADAKKVITDVFKGGLDALKKKLD